MSHIDNELINFDTIPKHIDVLELFICKFEQRYNELVHRRTELIYEIEIMKKESQQDLIYINNSLIKMLLNVNIIKTVEYWKKEEINVGLKRKLIIIEKLISNYIPLLKNELKIVVNTAKKNIDDYFSNIDWTRNDYEHRYPYETSSLCRKSMWESLPRLDDGMNKTAINLINQRNNFARQYLNNEDATYVDYLLQLLEFEKEEFLQSLYELEKNTREDYFNHINVVEEVQSIKPWDLKFLFYYPSYNSKIFNRSLSDILDIVILFFKDIGLDIKEIGISFIGISGRKKTSYLMYENKSSIKIFLDSNLKGLQLIKTIFSQVGIALSMVYNKHDDSLYQIEWGIYTNTMENIFVQIALSYNFLIERLGISLKDFNEFTTRLKRIQLYEIRRLACLSDLSIQSYDKCDQLEKIRSKLEFKYLGIDNANEVRWMRRELYGHNAEFKFSKLISIVIANQITNKFISDDNLQFILTEKLVNYLDEYIWSPGNSISFKGRYINLINN